MSRYAQQYTCGSCINYSYEGENSKGYCSYYRSYYYPSESCNHWEEGETENSGSSAGCFLSSACCCYKGLPDNCEELEKLRCFRDTYLKDRLGGTEIIKMYYSIAPQLVVAINKNTNQDKIYEEIYSNIQKILKLIDDGHKEDAVIEYMVMTMKLIEEHLLFLSAE